MNVIRIDAPIGDPRDTRSIWFVDVAKQLAAAPGPDVLVLIDSCGGSAREALAIYSALRASPHRIITRIDGNAYSAAGLIAMAGDRIEMVDGSRLMIHTSSRRGFLDDYSRLAGIAREVDETNVSLAGIYAQQTGRTAAEELARINGEDCWYSASVALAQGYVHAVVEPELCR